MKRIRIILAFAIFALVPIAVQADCSNAFVATISTAHHYIILGTGDVYAYDPSYSDDFIHKNFAAMGDVWLCKDWVGVEIRSKATGMGVAVRYVCNERTGC